MNAKFSPPPLRRAIVRARALDAVERAFEHSQALWIGAAPGSGKSTLAALAARQAASVWWYRVDALDKTPANFFSDISAMAGEHADDAERAALDNPRRWLRAILSRAPAGTMLVFDNVQEAAEIAPWVSLVLDELPRSLRAMFTSRSVPPAELANAVVKQQLAVLDPDFLTLSLEETRAMLPKGDEASALAIHRLTEGWAAGAVMLAASKERHDESTAAIDAYFRSELLSRLSAPSRRIVEATALLTEFDAVTAQTLSGASDAAHELDRLCAQHCFIVRRRADAHDHPRYRLHGLLRHLLRRELHDDAIVALYPRSRDALIALKQSIDAIELALDYNDINWAADRLGHDAPTLVRSNQLERLRAVLDRIPPAQIARDATLSYHVGMLELQVNELRAIPWFERSFHAFEAQGDVAGMTATTAAAMFAYHAEWANFDGLDAWIDRAQRTLNSVALETLKPPDRLRAALATVCSVLMSSNIDLSTPRAQQAIDVLAQSVISADDALDPTERCIASQVALEAYDFQGRLDEVAPLRAATEKLFESHAISDLRRGRWTLALGFFHYHHAALDDADAAWERTQIIVEQSALPALHSEILRARIHRALGEGRTDAAENYVRALGTLLDGHRPLLSGFYFNFRSRLYLAKHRFKEAVEAIELALVEADRGKLAVERRQFFHVTKAYALLGAERYHDAIAVLTLLGAQFSGKQRCMVDGTIATAQAFADRDAPTTFVPAIARALEQFRAAAPLAFLRPVPALLSALCSSALTHRIEVDFVRQVVRERALTPPPDAPAAWPWRVRVFTLSGFRIEIDDQPLVLSGKIPKKPLELLKFLASRPARESDVTRILQHCWPDADGDSARAAFDVAVSRLRKLLRIAETIVVSDGRCALNPAMVWTDTREFEFCVEQSRESAISAARAAALAQRVLDVYRGEFLRGESEAAWEVEARERYRAMFVAAAERLCEACMGPTEDAAGFALAERATEIEPLAERLYAVLIRAHLAHGRMIDAKRVYRRCEHMLSVMLGVPPSSTVRALIKES